MMQRKGLFATLLILAAVVAAGVVYYVISLQRQAAQPSTGPEAFKIGFVQGCLKQANDAALQQSKPFNEDQKRALQEICKCAADRTVAAFTTAELVAYQSNPTDPANLARVKEFLQNCATQTTMPAANP